MGVGGVYCLTLTFLKLSCMFEKHFPCLSNKQASWNTKEGGFSCHDENAKYACLIKKASLAVLLPLFQFPPTASRFPVSFCPETM